MAAKVSSGGSPRAPGGGSPRPPGTPEPAPSWQVVEVHAFVQGTIAFVDVRGLAPFALTCEIEAVCKRLKRELNCQGTILPAPPDNPGEAPTLVVRLRKASPARVVDVLVMVGIPRECIALT